MKSIHAVFLVALIWFLLGTFYYPKWNKLGPEAEISYDASGYYHYLPSIFIYHDVKKQEWVKAIHDKYLPSPALDQAFIHQPSGNKVNKYAIGQAVLELPFFLLGHAYAKVTGTYPADGYSKPYQFSIWFGALLVCVLGLFILRRIMLNYFEDTPIAWTILTLGLATNYMEYASITNAMNHSWLFTLLCALVYFSIQFYRKTNWSAVCGIGITLGLAVLTRPTEIVWILVPLLWGIESVKTRIAFLLHHWKKILVAVILCSLIMSIQSMYWKYVADEWIIYTYRDQGFNWFHPRIWQGLMGVQIGWFPYTPIMIVAMFGWIGLYKKYRSIFWPAFFTSMLAIYITFCWKHFESGGGLGQRNLIQVYPMLAFPLAMSIGWFLKSKWGKWIWIGLFLLNVYYNMWWSHQAHKGGFFQAGQMNPPYFYKIAGRLHPQRDHLKLLDTKEYFDGKPNDLQLVYENNFNADPASASLVDTIAGERAIVLNADHQTFGPLYIPLNSSCSKWLRAEADFTIQTREWDVWKFTQWVVQFYDGDKAIKTNLIRIQRLIPEDHKKTHLFFDVQLPNQSFTTCTITIWNGGSSQTIWIDNLKVSCFSP